MELHSMVWKEEPGLQHLLRKPQMSRTPLAPEFPTGVLITQHWFAVNEDLWLSLVWPPEAILFQYFGKIQRPEKVFTRNMSTQRERKRSVTHCSLLLFARHEWLQRNFNSVSYLAWGNSLFATDGWAAVRFQCATETNTELANHVWEERLTFWGVSLLQRSKVVFLESKWVPCASCCCPCRVLSNRTDGPIGLSKCSFWLFSLPRSFPFKYCLVRMFGIS